MAKRDIVGTTFGRLLVLSEAPSMADSRGKKQGMVIASCSCGASVVIRRNALITGNTRSCGCLQREETSARHTRHGHSRPGRSTPEVVAWHAMKQRCYYTQNINYKSYGGRGIRMCDRWLHSFESFLEDMGPRPSPQHSIDRIDTNGHYEPANCRWATRTTQQRNTTRNRWLTLDGITRSMAEWTELRGWGRSVIESRLARGWSVERAITVPLQSKLYPARAGDVLST